MNQIQHIIKEICKNKNIEYSLVSKDWIMILKRQNQVRYIVGYKFDLNDHGAGQICDDKYAFYDVLKQFELPLAEHYIVFKKYNLEEILTYAEIHQYHMVIKSNTGTCGNDMYYIKDASALEPTIEQLLKKHFSISLSPYYDIKTEYRCIVLNGKVELFYGKKRPIVYGNGTSTIHELLCKFNPHYFEEKQDSEWNRILNPNETYEYNWQFNLSKGAIPFWVEDEIIQNKVETLALKTAKILNLNFASIDIIELKTGEFLILEANSGVMMENFIRFFENGEQVAYSIYEKAVEAMFECI